MIGKIIAQLISVVMFVYMVLVGLTFIIHTTLIERVNDICYDIAETIGTEGVFSSEVYNYLCENLSRYGEYNVTLLLKDKDNGEIKYVFGPEEILDVSLSVGDRIIIAANSNTPTLFERITSSDSRICSVKIAVVG